ncbi:MAG: hypothetical protein ISS36_01135, partial [Candidatus Aenigmarchaeota archaeon]|nr:hypothetical protein [Candidatus Aenigmarchaeota archaeon]
MKNKKTQREEMRVELNDNFRKELFAKLFRKYPTRILMKEINMAQGTLYHYKNKRIPTIPIRLVKDFIQRADIDKRKLNSNIINITTTEKIRHKGLNIGRTKRKNQLKKWRREIPTINEIVDKNHLNLERWLKYYIKLINFGCRKFESVNKDNDKIILKYTNYSKGKKKKFTTNLPTKLNIDIDFQYFFGLWCGDRAGGGRVGILNKELELIYF